MTTLSDLSRMAAIMYTDTMSVYRRQTFINADGTIDNDISKYPLIKNVACRLSFRTLDPPLQSYDGSEPVTVQTKIFCALSVDVKAGDWLEITKRNGEIHEGVAGMPARRDFTQEILLTVQDRA